MLDPMFDSADYELCWPREVFARELAALSTEFDARKRADRIEFLLEEAFLGETPSGHYRAAADRPLNSGDPWDQPDPWAEPAQPARPGFLDRLAAGINELRIYQEPRPYWPDRHGRRRGQVDRDAVRHRFARLINDLYQRGHFGRDLHPECVDDPAPDEGAEVLASRLGTPGLWPLAPESWDEDTFLGLIEVFHDLAVRPRERNMHSFNGCGWHYSAFNSDTGRRLYRWRVNRLLDTAAIGLQLADSGQDVGRLVHVTDDARTELVERVLQTPDAGTADRVAHAVAQFRGRDATEHDKRSAVITLAGVLEERRELIKAELGRKDEGALFTLANEFAVRHQRRGQQGDYDPAFLDWMVWWYLGTIEVTNQILARQDVRDAS